MCIGNPSEFFWKCVFNPIHNIFVCIHWIFHFFVCFLTNNSHTTVTKLSFAWIQFGNAFAYRYWTEHKKGILQSKQRMRFTFYQLKRWIDIVSISFKFSLLLLNRDSSINYNKICTKNKQNTGKCFTSATTKLFSECNTPSGVRFRSFV